MPAATIQISTNSDLKETVLAGLGKERAALRDYYKGKIWMADDFDAPLEEMREYME